MKLLWAVSWVMWLTAPVFTPIPELFQRTGGAFSFSQSDRALYAQAMKERLSRPQSDDSEGETSIW